MATARVIRPCYGCVGHCIRHPVTLTYEPLPTTQNPEAEGWVLSAWGDRRLHPDGDAVWLCPACAAEYGYTSNLYAGLLDIALRELAAADYCRKLIEPTNGQVWFAPEEAWDPFHAWAIFDEQGRELHRHVLPEPCTIGRGSGFRLSIPPRVLGRARLERRHLIEAEQRSAHRVLTLRLDGGAALAAAAAAVGGLTDSLRHHAAAAAQAETQRMLYDNRDPTIRFEMEAGNNWTIGIDDHEQHLLKIHSGLALAEEVETLQGPSPTQENMIEL